MILRRAEDAICLSLYRDRNEGNCGGGSTRSSRRLLIVSTANSGI
jgi:hypothetical protein